jgi:hypothetical protein
MDIWNVRNQALVALDTNLRQEKEVLDKGFALLDECIDHLHEVAIRDNENTRFAAICCQTLVKARRFALGIYSLCLDSLVLEAGALMRVLKEAWQLLIYFHQDPSRIEEAFVENLPQAGVIAQKINVELHNQLKGLTDYYNTTTSHISFSEDALVPIGMVFSSENLKGNMRSLFLVISSILYEGAAPCLHNSDQLDAVLYDEIASSIEKGLRVFDIDADSEELHLH